MEIGQEVVERCRHLAAHTEEPGWITRRFLSEPMHRVHADLRAWMEQAGMSVRCRRRRQSARTLRRLRRADAPRLIVGSHLDTVPHAGAFDGILGVVLGVALVKALSGRRLGFGIEVVGFSEEEGVRFGLPFIGSRALAGSFDDALLARRDAEGVLRRRRHSRIRSESSGHWRGARDRRDARLPGVSYRARPGAGELESSARRRYVHCRAEPAGVRFEGKANHAGTTPMHLRRDALAGAAEWIGAVEREAAAVPSLVATVGKIEARTGGRQCHRGLRPHEPGRPPHATTRCAQTPWNILLDAAQQIAARRGLVASSELRLDQAAVAMDARLIEMLGCAVRARRLHGASHA